MSVSCVIPKFCCLFIIPYRAFSLTLKIEKVGGGQNPMIGTAVGLESTFTIKRSDFDMKNMLEAVPDNVLLIVSVEASHR